MIPLGIILAFGGYGIGSWGYCLLKGWDIPLKAWFDPLAPYQWPKGGGDPSPIPNTQIFPSSAGAAKAKAATGHGGGQGTGGSGGPTGQAV